MAESSLLRPPSPRAITQLAAGFRSVQIAGGKRKASGDITYAANLSAGATITVAGVVFTAVVSGSNSVQFDVAASLTLTLDAIAAKLNASVDPLVAAATYSNVGGTKLGVSYDVASADGNAFTLAASAGGTVSAATLTGGRSADKIDLKVNSVVELVTAAGVAEDFTLPAGQEGQMITVFLRTKGAGANAIVAGSFVGGTAATFDTVGEFMCLQFLSDLWRPLINSGVTIA